MLESLLVKWQQAWLESKIQCRIKKISINTNTHIDDDSNVEHFLPVKRSDNLPYRIANGAATTCVIKRIMSKLVELIPRSVPYAVDIVMMVPTPSI